MTRGRLRLVGFGLLLALASCGSAPPPNIVLISLESTRADHLGAYGYPDASTPNLDRFAERATVYERAYSTSSWTPPSHASLLTGLLPMQHGLVGYIGSVRALEDSFTTLAESLGTAGYQSAAVVSGAPLRAELGLAQGFDVYDDDLPDGVVGAIHGKRAEKTADQAIAHVKRFQERPYLLFVHFWDPHSPYRPPAPFVEDLPAVEQKSVVMEELFPRVLSDAPPRPRAELGPAVRDYIAGQIAGYDAEIRYMDRHLGRLLDAIDSSPRADNSIVVITSDHGESFGEHYYMGHRYHLYEDNVRVPLLVRFPGQTSGRRVSAPVQNHQAFVSMLEAAGVDPPAEVTTLELDAPGAVVVTEVRRAPIHVRLFGPYFDRDLRALYAWPHKLIWSSAGALELFDLERDPGDLRNLQADESELARSLARTLAIIEDQKPPLFRQEDSGSDVLEPDTKEALRALGYLE